MNLYDGMIREDIRKVKTDKALKIALLALLNRRNFNQITVSDLCKEALVSRATFYSHFTDKYDLLKAWLADIVAGITKAMHSYAELEASVNQYLADNAKVVKNTLNYADGETLEVARSFLFDVVELFVKKEVGDTLSPDHTVLFNFCAGGLIQLLLWQVKNDFPPQAPMANAYLHKMWETIMEWDAGQGD